MIITVTYDHKGREESFWLFTHLDEIPSQQGASRVISGFDDYQKKDGWYYIPVEFIDGQLMPFRMATPRGPYRYLETAFGEAINYYTGLWTREDPGNVPEIQEG